MNSLIKNHRSGVSIKSYHFLREAFKVDPLPARRSPASPETHQSGEFTVRLAQIPKVLGKWSPLHRRSSLGFHQFTELLR